MKALFTEIKEWKQGYFQYLKYSFKLTLWLYRNRWKKFTTFLKRHVGFVRRFSLPVLGLGVGLLVNQYSGINFTQDILSSYLVATGAMIGGTIAIVFTISIFLIQNAADLYSSQYFEVYIHDWKEKFVYFVVIVITLLFLGGGLYVGGLQTIPSAVSYWTVLLSLFFIGLVFALIDWQYKNVRNKLNPSQAIFFLEKEGVRFLKRLQSDAEQLAAVLKARDGSMSNEMALATTYNHFLKPFISNLDRQLENLIEISLKLGDKHEVGTTKRGFTAFYNVLIGFLDARKTSSLILPSGTTFLAIESDSQSFLHRNFERLNKAGEKFIKEGKDELATYIIDVYRGLAIKTQEISFVGRTNENPILDSLVGNLNFFIENGQRANNIEVVFQGLGVLGDISVMAAHKGYSTTLHGLIEKIMSVAIYGLTQKQMVIVDRCSTTFLRIIGAVFASDKVVRKHHLDDALKNIATISAYISSFIKSGLLPNNIPTRFSLSKGYDEFYTTIVVIFNLYATLTDDRDKQRYRSDLIELFREINLSIRKLSETVKECDSVLTDSVGRLLANINNLIVHLIQHQDFQGNKNELEKWLSWNINLPSWFAHHAEKFDGGSNPFNTLTDSVAKTGILAAEELNDKEMVKTAIDCLYSITNHALEKTTGSYGYDEPRILEKACYLGIIAHKKGWDEVVIDLGVKIHEFEKKYFEKYLTKLPERIDPQNHNVMGLPHHDQLVRELWRWRDDYERERMNGMLRMRDDAESMMYEVVERIDIDRFIFEVWNVFISDSEFEEELELKWARQRLIRTLKRIAIKKDE